MFERDASQVTALDLCTSRREIMLAALLAPLVAAPVSRALAQAAEPLAADSLLPRRIVFGNPERVSLEISPDGRHLSWKAPLDGVMNAFVAPAGDLAAARPVTAAKKRPISSHTWAWDSRHVIYADDANGDENTRIYSVDIVSGTRRDLTALAGVQARFVAASPEHPDRIVVGLNDRDAKWHDLYIVDLATGERRLLRHNTENLSGFRIDRQLTVRLATRSENDGSTTVLRVSGDRLEPLLTIPFADAMSSSPSHLTAAGDAWYLRSSIGRDRAALFRVDVATGAQRLVAEHARADVGAMITDPVTREVLAVSANHLRHEWMALDAGVGAELARLAGEAGGDVYLMSQTRDGRRWIVGSTSALQPSTYFLYDRDTKQLQRLFAAMPALEAYKLSPMHPVVIRSRDGLDLVSYLSLPPTAEGPRPARPLPMVLDVHGGPWHRDAYGFNPTHQLLANRGYAVLSVNFRGSTGFGKAFVNAADLEWGRKMHDDLIDAVEWAYREGIAERGRVAIMGASYGGYAALAGLAFTPDVFRCGVDIVGPSNLETLLATVPPYWASFFENWARRVGDPRTEAGRALLRERSPLHRAGAIERPLLILQGANDPRVKQAESDQIVAAMKAHGLAVTYALYPDEGHGFARPENNISAMATVEAFLAVHMGVGRAEPFGTDLDGSSITVPEGARHVPGLEAALAAKRG